MGWEYAGTYGALCGMVYAIGSNVISGRAWFRRPWVHVTSVTLSYLGSKLLDEVQDTYYLEHLKRVERKGLQVTEEHKKLFSAY
uniref:B14.5b n=1 Tax=Polytomella sp. Pringsheim 198.80 TaxID=37502 RepID=UPI001E1E23D6|nr:Chain d, B14.5b [Polytomella sp. Pringsheim 198.80]7ARD_d Chain d, B14.5b [Polytomella sp. Pringsheim 198.80]